MSPSPYVLSCWWDVTKHNLNVLQLSDNPGEMTRVLPCSLLFAILGHLSANILLNIQMYCNKNYNYMIVR